MSQIMNVCYTVHAHNNVSVSPHEKATRTKPVAWRQLCFLDFGMENAGRFLDLRYPRDEVDCN